MEMDRQAIERRDFPIVRRGYDPASVDAHLRALASAVEELRDAAGGVARDSLAAVAGAQVQGILEAAQASAQEIESDAADHAARVRADAEAAAQATREQAIATARERVSAVTQATEALLQRVGSMDGEARTLVESVRGGAGRLVGDLEALSEEMSGLYDAASGHTGVPAPAAPAPWESSAPAPAGPTDELTAPAEGFLDSPTPTMSASPATSAPAENGMLAESPGATEGSLFDESEDGGAQASGEEDLDGARLVALNMALNGDSREATGRYLAENFQVLDPERLLDEVYAAIEA